MRAYELLVVIRPDIEEEATQAVLAKIRSIITDNGGEIEKEDIWGKRRLAYEIRRYREGFYAIFNFKSESKVPDELNRVLRITDEVIRFMTVRPEE